jgi:hypothetical protein
VKGLRIWDCVRIKDKRKKTKDKRKKTKDKRKKTKDKRKKIEANLVTPRCYAGLKTVNQIQELTLQKELWCRVKNGQPNSGIDKFPTSDLRPLISLIIAVRSRDKRPPISDL